LLAQGFLQLIHEQPRLVDVQPDLDGHGLGLEGGLPDLVKVDLPVGFLSDGVSDGQDDGDPEYQLAEIGVAHGGFDVLLLWNFL